jgi:hypothetical protein
VIHTPKPKCDWSAWRRIGQQWRKVA